MKTMKTCTHVLLTNYQLVIRDFLAFISRKFDFLFQKTALGFLLFFAILGTSSTAFAQVTHLYLSDPNQALDRVDPVATADNTTASSYRVYATSPGITVDAVSTRVANTGPITQAHTTGTESNRLMLVGISQKNRTVTSVTYGGTPLTLVGENIANSSARISIYKLINPPSGTANVVVNFSSNPDKGAIVSITTFNNVDQTTPLGTFASAQGNSSAQTVNVTSAAGELVYDVVAKRNQSLTVGALQTQRWNLHSGWEMYGGGSTEPGVATTTMSWTAASENWAIGAVPIKPSSQFNTISFIQTPALCSGLTITTGGNINITNYLSNITGVIPANPSITAVLKYGGTNIISINNPTYNSGTGLLTWTGTLGANVTIPAGQVITLEITNLQAGTSYKIDFDSQTKPSKVSFTTSTYVNVNSVAVYSAAYPGGSIVTSTVAGNTRYIRAVVSNPFGTADINGTDFTITPTGSVVAGTLVATSGCTRTYEYAWVLPILTTDYVVTATGKQGYENVLTHSLNTNFTACINCYPDAVNDADTAKGGQFTIVDVIANDYDANNNINRSSLTIITQPRNGIGYISNGNILYLPNGSYEGYDTVTYRICDSTSLCDTAQLFLVVTASIYDPCEDATQGHIYYLPYSENEARIALDSSSSVALVSNNIRTIISLRLPYTGTTVTWDHWEDGYETNILNPLQSTTLVWGDGNPFNGIAPGFPNDLIPGSGSIVLDNTIPTNPRVPANQFYDGKDKIYSSGQIAVTQVCGEPSIIGLQCMKTNVSSTLEYGYSFTVPVGQNFNSKDFLYSSLFIRASENNTIINIDKDNNGTLETTDTLSEGEVFHLNGAVLTGAVVTASAPIGCDLHFGGNDNYSSRDIPLYPASWYSNTYYSPVPTTGSATNPADTAVVMLYNSLNSPMSINWSSGIPSSGTIVIPAKSAVRFPLAKSQTAAYKFVNPTGESFTALEIVDSYTPGGGGNSGSTFDWSFNLIADSRLTDFSTIAWAPGSTDGSRNDNPVWITPTANTTIYVKYDGNIVSGGSLSPCGFRYDVSYAVNALNFKRILDAGDNDQSGLSVYTCDGTKIAAVYGEDPYTASTANPSWDVGTTLQPFCKGKLIFANDDYTTTLVGQPVTIAIFTNDFGFQSTIDPLTVVNFGLLQPKNGTVSINSVGTLLYTPNAGFTGNDTLDYQVCSTPTIVCDIARVYISISACPSNNNNNTISGQVFFDTNKDGVDNDGATGVPGSKVFLYVDGDCDGVIDAGELTDSVTVDNSGFYQFVENPEKIIADDFEGVGGARSCANGTDGNTPWATNWVDAGDPSTGYCVSFLNTTDAEIIKDGAFSYGLRIKDNNVSATRTFNLSSASKAFLTFDYRKKVALASGEDVLVQASTNGVGFTTIYTISGNGSADASYVTVYNQDITPYISATTYLRFLTNNNVDDADTVYIDNIKINFYKYSQCYITKPDPLTVASDSYITSVAERTASFANGGTCTSANDFGISKISITISGTLYNDTNGLTDGLVNGSATGTPGGATVYAYLVNSSGKIALKTTVNSGTGAYSFPLAGVNTTYTLILSTADSALLSAAPPTLGLAADWVSVGDAYGSTNDAGTGNELGTPNTRITVKTLLTNVPNVNFGIERLPTSNNNYVSITHPFIGQVIPLNGGVNPPVLSGADAEDCNLGCTLSTRSVLIDTVPSNSDLYYNNVLLADGQLISNFNPALFEIRVTNASIGDTLIYFRYSFVDVAGRKSLNPAKYELSWNWPLPADGLIAKVNLYNNIATVSWSTLSEQNTNYFVLERSLDNNNYYVTGNMVKAIGNSTTKQSYEQPDNISSLTQQAIIYYRVKLFDLDGKVKYSNVLPLRLSQKPEVTIRPNPFTTAISISITTEKETILDIKLTDLSGRKIKKISQTAKKGISVITFDRLEQLPAGVYIVEVSDMNGGKTYQKCLKNE